MQLWQVLKLFGVASAMVLTSLSIRIAAAQEEGGSERPYLQATRLVRGAAYVSEGCPSCHRRWPHGS